MYDLIGDIHGHAEPLKRLLKKLGYGIGQDAWQHPERKVIFLGDFVDRGPAQIETLCIARNMVESGNALAVMGNHEFNAVAWATRDPDNPEHALRRHNEKNRRQHQAFLAQVSEESSMHEESIAWFKTLPLYLDLPGLRVVHACWHPASLQTLSRYLDQVHRVLPEAWVTLCRKGTEGYEAAETILKGAEIELPSGYTFIDKDQTTRHHIRTKWWESRELTYRNAALAPSSITETLPDILVPESMLAPYDEKKPLFVGHYWLTEDPRLLSPHIACLDYSIAAEKTDDQGKQGKLCAYRWTGESILSNDHFVWVN